MSVAIVERQPGGGPISGKDLCRIIKNRITMSTPSKKSVIRRRKKGHFTDSDLSYHTFICVVHHASIGLSDDDGDIVLADVDTAATAEDRAVDNLLFSDDCIFLIIIPLCRIRVLEDSLDFESVIFGNLS